MALAADDSHALLLTPLISTLHLVGPGGAGKTSVGPFLAQYLGWQFVDLDGLFMSCEGSISAYINDAGYVGYARRNVEIYEQKKAALAVSTVFALSSGFMTYPVETGPRYQALREAIEMDSLTALLLPSFTLESCVNMIVQRQLSQHYLAGNKENEERRIRARFSTFMSLRCARFRSDATPDQIASQIEDFVRGR